MTITPQKIVLNDLAQARRRPLVETVSKTIYEGPECSTHVLYFKDEIDISGNIETISGKGILNSRISELLFTRIANLGIDTHFIRTLNMREQLVHATDPLPFTITLHNVATGHLAQRLGLEDGMALLKPLPEFTVRSQELGNPVVAAEHLISLGWSRFEEIDDIIMSTQRINDFLNGQFLAFNLRLMSFSLQFGKFYHPDLMDPQLMIIDELSPEKFSLIDLATGNRFDLQGMEDCPEEAHNIYQEIARKLGVLNPESTDSLASATTPNLFSQNKVVQPQPFNQRNNPHGHNSL